MRRQPIPSAPMRLSQGLTRRDATATTRRRAILFSLAMAALASGLLFVSEWRAGVPDLGRLIMLGSIGLLFPALAAWLWRRPAALAPVQGLMFTVGAGVILVRHVLLLHTFPREQLLENLFNVMPWIPIVYVLAFVLFSPQRGLYVAGAAFVAFLASTASFMATGRADLLPRRMVTALWIHSTAAPLAYIAVLTVVARSKVVDDAKTERLRSLRDIATRDALTGLVNRRGLALHHDTLAGAGATLGLALFDIDHFKQVNDTHGHDVGDAVLQGLAERVRASLRPGDVLGRWGGEEFVLLLPGASGAQAAAAVERIRAAVASEGIGGVPRVTASFGVVTVAAGEPLDAAVERADKLLYAAKRAGRNRVMAA